MAPELAGRGYVVLPGALTLSQLERARETLSRELREPPEGRRVHPYWVSWFPPLGTFTPLLEEKHPLWPSLRRRVEAALGESFQATGEQVSLRYPEWSAPCELVPHVDDGAGVVFEWTLGIMLTDCSAPWRGNLAVWSPGETEPQQLCLQAGDAVLLGGLLPHAPAPNLVSAGGIQIREALYFRLGRVP